MTTLYAADDGLVAPLSSSECLVQNPRTQERHVMTFEVLQALDQCKSFRSLDEHLGAVLEALPQLKGQSEAARRVLQGMIERGLLVSADSVVAELAAAPARTQAALGPIFLLAEDRPEGLGRALDSLARAGDPGLDELPVWVLDASRAQASREANRRVIAERSRAAGLGYLGAEDRARFVEALKARVPEAAQALTWLLQDERSNARAQLYNWMLLLGAGRRVLVMDDRQFLPLRRLPEAGGGIDFLHSHQREAWFFGGEMPMPAREVDAEEDLWSYQAQRVGESLGRVATRAGALQLAPASLRNASLPALRQFEPGGRIAALLFGTAGSLETPHNIWLYQLDQASRERFWASREAYLRTYEGDNVCHGLRRARVLLSPVHQASALDLAGATGFAIPLGAAAVGYSHGALTRALDPDAVALHSTALIGSQWQPNGKRSTTARQAYTPNSARFFADHLLARSGDSRAQSAQARAQYLAGALEDLAASSTGNRKTQLGDYLTYRRAELVADLQARLEAAGSAAPVYWEADLREIIQGTGKEIVRGQSCRLGEWPEALDEAACAERLSQEAIQLAAALRAWPALCASASAVAPKFLA